MGGSAYTTYFRMLDVRLGRWFKTDIIPQPWQSSYCSMDNNPICNTDIMGSYVIPKGMSGKQKEKMQKIIDATRAMLENDLEIRAAFIRYSGYQTWEEVQEKLLKDGEGPTLKFENNLFNDEEGAGGMFDKKTNTIYLDKKLFTDPKHSGGSVNTYFGGRTLLHESVHYGRRSNLKRERFNSTEKKTIRDRVGDEFFNKMKETTKDLGYTTGKESGIWFEMEAFGSMPEYDVEQDIKGNYRLESKSVGGEYLKYYNKHYDLSDEHLRFKLETTMPGYEFNYMFNFQNPTNSGGARYDLNTTPHKSGL